MGNKTANIWKAWVNVIKRLKLTKSKTKEFELRKSILNKKFAL
mgnify:CR=1 FL=1